MLNERGDLVWFREKDNVENREGGGGVVIVVRKNNLLNSGIEVQGNNLIRIRSWGGVLVEVRGNNLFRIR